VRPDKKKANHISVVFDTFEAAAENITQDEILYRVMVRPEADQYFRQIKKMHASVGCSLVCAVCGDCDCDCGGGELSECV
jgi:hypothetical protein